MHNPRGTGCLLLTVALLATILSPMKSEAVSPRRCIRETCKTPKRRCLRAFKDEFRTARGACSEVEARRECRRANKKVFKRHKDACRYGFKSCKRCCRGDQAGCSIVTCGDGIRVDGEECDDGNIIDGDGCDSDCSVTRCGNGIVTEGEACDDGNPDEGDGCSRDCEVEDEALIACIGECRSVKDSWCGSLKDKYKAALAGCKAELNKAKGEYRAAREVCRQRERIAVAQCKDEELQALKSCRRANKLCKKDVKRASRSCKTADRTCGVAATRQALQSCQEAYGECRVEAGRTNSQCNREAKVADRDCRRDAKNAYRAERVLYSECRRIAKAAYNQCLDEYTACTSCCKKDLAQSCLLPRTVCRANEVGGPNSLTVTVVKGGDLDVGWTGVGHNQHVAAHVEMFACLQGCDRNAVPVCTGTGPVGQGSLNGAMLGPPLPMVMAGVAFCVVSEFAEDVTVRALDLQSGEMEMRISLNSTVYLAGDKKNPCPTCSGERLGERGTCEGPTPSEGNSCTTDGITENFGNVSSDCLPFSEDSVGELDMVFDPVTSERTELPARTPCPGGSCPCLPPESPPSPPLQMNDCDHSDDCAPENCPSDPWIGGFPPGEDQACCRRGDRIIPCFGETISRTGAAIPPQPLWPDPRYPKSSEGRMASVFCVPPTRMSLVNMAYGIGGPGAFVLPVRTHVDFSP